MGFLMKTRILKNSGIAWIGEIPKHWEVKKAKYLFKNKKEIVGTRAEFTDRLALTLNGVVKRSKDDNEGLQPKKFESYQTLRKNNLVFKLIDLENISTSRVGISNFDLGIVSPAYIVLQRKENNKFFYYFFMSMYYGCVFNFLGGQGVRSSLNVSDLLNLYLPVPPLNEQERIAEFLDKKCASIDSSIENLEQKTKSLAQYKKALITQCVTKGLNPKILEFKDSEIPWIRQIPKHWEISKIKYVAKIRSENSSFNAENDKYIGLENVAGYLNSLIETNTEYENSIQAVCKKGDILFGKLRPYLSKVIIAPFNCFCSSEFLQFINLKCYFKFFYYFLLNKNFIENVNSSTYGAKMPRANSNYIMNLNFLVPPLNEQKEIAEFLDNKCEKIDRLNENYTKQIATLKEYKKSLIYECVTGKKEI